MLRIDLHIVRTSRGWLVQNANARTLAVFRKVDDAIENGEARARQFQARRLNVRLSIHAPGRRALIRDFPALVEACESYALKFCRLS